jgi:signal transduction histidine kinase
VLDTLIALVVLGIGLAEVVSGQLHGPRWACLTAVLAISAGVLLRRVETWAAVVLAFAAIPLSYAAGVDQTNFAAAIVGALTVMFTAGYLLQRRPAVLALAFGFACVAVTNQLDLLSIGWLVIVIGGAWAAGRSLRSRRILIDDLRATTAELELSREALAARAVADERLRIARDIHDVVSHSVTVMLVQAGAAEQTLQRGGPEALDAIRAVQDCGRQALAELREMLGVLRVEGEPGATRTAPQPGLGDLDALMAQFREAGLDVTFDGTAALGDAPGYAGLTAYRVVQEALTNVLKHSASRTANVGISEVAGQLVVEVLDDGPPHDAGSAQPLTGGHGIAGMRERVAAAGGQFSAGPTAAGGFRVEARLPVTVAV